MKRTLTLPGMKGTPIDTNLPAGVPTGGLDTGQRILQTGFVLIVTLAIVSSIWFLYKGGWDIITSKGHKEKIKSGRESIIYAILGLIFLFLSFFILNVAHMLFNYDFLCFVFSPNPLTACK